MTSSIPDAYRSEWFAERYHDAADQVIETFGSTFFSLTGTAVADIGCGDGIVALGVFRKVAPAALVGFDVEPTDTAALSQLAAQEGVSGELPAGLEFRTSPAEKLAAADGEFDFAFSWSAFHHIAGPEAAIAELRRVLRPEGALMIQIYPFFESAHGSLLEQWYPEGFAHLTAADAEAEERLRSDPGPDPAWAQHVLDMRRGLNRIDLDSLGRMLEAGGFRVVRLHLIAEDTPIPPEAAGLPLSRIGVAGVRLVAVRI